MKMKKINILKVFCTALIMGFVISFNTIPASADLVSAAGQVPAGYGYTHGRIPVVHSSGAPEIHDQNLMRYDRNSKLPKDGFSKYQKYGYGVNENETNTNYQQDNYEQNN